MDDTTLAVILWGVAALVLGWTWVPAIISGLGGTRYSNGGSDDPTALPPAADEPDYAFWHRQITALGHEPVGPGWMRINFHGPDWRYETRVRAFFSRTKQTFCFVQQQPRPMDVWWLTMFATCWQDGGLLLTGNAMDEAPGEGDYVVQGMESTDLAAVEALHMGLRDRLQAAGRRPDPDGSLETLLRATRQHAGDAARFVGLKLGQTYIATHLFIHAFLTVPPAYLMGLGHWSVPMVNAILGGVLLTSEHLAKRRAGALMREQVMAKVGGRA
jgi:hypothetical protein